MYYVLLSGGSGKRLWPLSGEARPKQYLKLLHKEKNSMETASMLQRVWEQLEEAGISEKTVITAEESQTELIRSQVRSTDIVVEPKQRDTFAAILLSCAYLRSEKGASPEDYVTVLSVDFYTEGSYFETIKRMEDIMKKHRPQIGLMGVRPTYPATKYGYILPKKEEEGCFFVKGFHEKPDQQTAEKLLQEGALWNCGVFCIKIGDMLTLASKYVTSISYEAMKLEYDKFPKISFDYEVTEKAKHLVVLPYEGYWKDIGTWETMAEQMSTDTVGNVLMDDSCRETQVINELGLPMAVTGTHNLVVVASREGILVADKNYTEDLKRIVLGLTSAPMFEERRWGTLETLDETRQEDNITLTRKITIWEGMNSSYHYHEDRDEIWTIMKGRGELILEGSKISLFPGKAVCIRKNQRHAVKAEEDLQYIEIHVGTKVGNEDIHRITFRWDEIGTANIL